MLQQAHPSERRDDNTCTAWDTSCRGQATPCYNKPPPLARVPSRQGRWVYGLASHPETKQTRGTAHLSVLSTNIWENIFATGLNQTRCTLQRCESSERSWCRRAWSTDYPSWTTCTANDLRWGQSPTDVSSLKRLPWALDRVYLLPLLKLCVMYLRRDTVRIEPGFQ